MANAEETIYHLKDIVDNYDEKENSFKKYYFSTHPGRHAVLALATSEQEL